MRNRFTNLRRGLALAVLFATGSLAAQAQNVGIGTTAPNASAALDIVSSTKGALLPRLTSAQRGTIANPATGLLMFQTDAPMGFYYNAGTAAAPQWQLLNPNGDNLGNHTATQDLKLGTYALTGTGADLGTIIGLGIRADGGLNLGQNTTGQNIYLGYQAGQSNTTGSNNLFSGYQSGINNTTGNNNLFSGSSSGFSNTTGSNNLFSGSFSGYRNTTGNNNLFSGTNSGQNNTTGYNNLFSGVNSGQNNTTGYDNLFSGYQSGQNNTTGNNNQFSGNASGQNNTTGSFNFMEGPGAGMRTTTGGGNLFVGWLAGQLGNGDRNLAIGAQAGRANVASDNHFVGFFAGTAVSTGSRNTFEGNYTGVNTTTGGQNTFVGYQAGSDNSTGNNNFGVGYMAGPSSGGLTNAGAIGYNARVSQSNSLVLGGTGASAVSVGIGTTAPTQALDVNGGILARSTNTISNQGAYLHWNRSGTDGETWLINHLGSGTADAGIRFGGITSSSGTAVTEWARIDNSGNMAINSPSAYGYRLYVNGTVSGTSFTNISDRRLKTDIRPLTGALALVQALHGHRYLWNAQGVALGGTAQREQVGVIAQELETVLPELVSTGTNGIKTVNYAQLTPVLVEAIKEQQQQIEALKAQNQILQARTALVEADHASLLSLQAQLARLLGEGAQAQK